MGTIRPFEDEAVYKRIFLEQPGTEFWQRYADPDFPEPEDDLFSAGEPSAYQMMLASTLTKYAAARQVS